MNTNLALAEPAAEPATARELRMLTVLLAATDPCGCVHGGASPDGYAEVALDVLRRLQLGADAVELLQAFPGEANALAAADFARTAVDWWYDARSFRPEALQPATLAFAS